MSTQCQYPDCTVTVQSSGKGRPRKYCPDHAQTVKRQRDRGRLRGKRVQQFATLLCYDCCADAKRVNPRVRSCEQHKQWRAFLRQGRTTIMADRTAGDANAADLAGLVQSGAFRVSKDPDAWIAGKQADDYRNDAWLRKHDPEFLRRKRETSCVGESIPDEPDYPKAA